MLSPRRVRPLSGRARPCGAEDFAAVLDIVNAAARAYAGVIPADRWRDPYMSEDALRREIASDVRFLGHDEGGVLVGVMGVQAKGEVTLVRHAYVQPDFQGRGIGGGLLAALSAEVETPLLVGTWAAAVWAIRFYEKNGFRLVSTAEKDRLLRAYWSIPERQIATSVVLADDAWFAAGAIA